VKGFGRGSHCQGGRVACVDAYIHTLGFVNKETKQSIDCTLSSNIDWEQIETGFKSLPQGRFPRGSVDADAS
jgi:hypothetical protein